AEYPVRDAVGEQQRGQTTHRVTDNVEAVDAELLEGGEGDVDQERDGDEVETGARGGAEAGGVIGEEGVAGQTGEPGEVGVLLLRGAEAVKKDHRLRARHAVGADAQVDA